MKEFLDKQRLTFPFPFVHHQSHVYQQPRPSGTTINRRNEDTWPVTAAVSAGKKE